MAYENYSFVSWTTGTPITGDRLSQMSTNIEQVKDATDDKPQGILKFKQISVNSNTFSDYNEHELVNLSAPIDVLIHNAGVYLTKRELTSDGIEKVFVVHYLSSFIINYILRDKLKSQDHARIILVNSEGHRFAVWGIHLDDLNWEKRRYSGLKSYGSAKMAQLLTMLV